MSKEIKYAEKANEPFFINHDLGDELYFANFVPHYLTTNKPLKRDTIIKLQSGQRLVVVEDSINVGGHRFAGNSYPTYKNMFSLITDDGTEYVKADFISSSVTFEIDREKHVEKPWVNKKARELNDRLLKSSKEYIENLESPGKDPKPFEIEMKEDFEVVDKRPDSEIIEDAVLLIKFKNGDIRQAVLDPDNTNKLLNFINDYLGGIKVLNELITAVEFERR